MTAGPAPLFGFVQVEVPWPVGPPDGRYVLRPDGDPDASVRHVIVVATLGAAPRQRMRGPGPPPAAPRWGAAEVAIGRATIIDTTEPLADDDAAGQWLRSAGE